jgi:hypothetical protein
MLTVDEIIEKMMAELSPAEKEAYEKEQAEAGLIYLQHLLKYPEKLKEVLPKLPKELRELMLNILSQSKN